MSTQLELIAAMLKGYTISNADVQYRIVDGQLQACNEGNWHAASILPRANVEWSFLPRWKEISYQEAYTTPYSQLYYSIPGNDIIKNHVTFAQNKFPLGCKFYLQEP